MIKICLKYSTSQLQEKAVRAAVKYEIIYNPNLKGAEFEINRGDFNQIDGISGYDGDALIRIVDRAVRTA